MASKKLVSGAAWPSTGAATAATTGLSVLSGTVTHVASDDVPPLSLATGYVEFGESVDGTFRLDATADIFSGAETDYWLRFWVKGVRTLNALAADATTWRWLTLADSGTKATFTAYVRNNAYRPGLNLIVANLISGGSVEHGSTEGSSGSAANMAWDCWNELAVHMSLGAAGVYEVYLNGTMVGRGYNLNTAGLAIANVRSSWTVSVKGVAGIVWRLAGPIDSWSGVGIGLRPRHDLNPSTDLVSQYLTQRWSGLPNPGNGGCFVLSGTATSTVTAYTESGTSPYRSRVVASGSAGQTCASTTIDDIGVLPYNSEGWATLYWPMTYLPGGATGSWIVRDAGGSVLVQLDYDGSNLLQGSTVLCPLSATSRVGLAIHLASDGAAAYTLLDLTADYGTAREVWSGALAGWVPAAVGKVSSTAVIGSANCEIDGLAVCRWLDIVGIDSLSSASAASTTPVLATANHVASRAMSRGSDDSAHPGGAYYMQSSGAPRTHALAIAGRSGRRRSSWSTNVRPYLCGSRGIRLVMVDGGSINDIAAISGDKAAAVASLAAQIAADVAAMTAVGNRVWISTMIRREQGTYTEEQLEAINELNVQIRSIARQLQVSGLVELSDPAAECGKHASLFTAGDDTHFNAAGDLTVSQDMVTSMTTPEQSAVTLTSDERDALASVIWSAAARTLTAFGFTVETASDAAVTAIQERTDNLPDAPAAVGDEMTLTSGERVSIGTAVVSAMPKPYTDAAVDDDAPTASSFIAAGLSSDNARQMLVFVSGANAGATGRVITAVSVEGRVTLSSAFQHAPADGDQCIAIGGKW